MSSTGSQVAIYALCEFPNLEAVRYVGQSAKPERRLYNHIAAHRERNHRRNWINAVIASGGAVGCVVIEWVRSDQADAAERYWINELSSQGYRLTNGKSLYGPVTDYQTSKMFEPLASRVLRTIPYRHESEWHEDDLVKQGRAMVRSGVDMRAVLDDLFWQGMQAINSGAVTLADMRVLEEQGRCLLAERQSRKDAASYGG